jgi:hypothetical protein
VGQKITTHTCKFDSHLFCNIQLTLLAKIYHFAPVQCANTVSPSAQLPLLLNARGANPLCNPGNALTLASCCQTLSGNGPERAHNKNQSLSLISWQPKTLEPGTTKAQSTLCRRHSLFAPRRWCTGSRLSIFLRVLRTQSCQESKGRMGS